MILRKKWAFAMSSANFPKLLLQSAFENCDFKRVIDTIDILLTCCDHRRLSNQADLCSYFELLFTIYGLDCSDLERNIRGAIGPIVLCKKFVYVINFHIDSSSHLTALQQTQSNGCIEPYMYAKDVRYIAIGINYSSEKGQIVDWGMQECTINRQTHTVTYNDFPQEPTQ